MVCRFPPGRFAAAAARASASEETRFDRSGVGGGQGHRGCLQGLSRGRQCHRFVRDAEVVLHLRWYGWSPHAYTEFRKAYTALTFKMPTSQVGALTKTDPSVLAKIKSDTNLLTFAGGLPLTAGGEVIGAIGVSGAEPKCKGRRMRTHRHRQRSRTVSSRRRGVHHDAGCLPTRQSSWIMMAAISSQTLVQASGRPRLGWQPSEAACSRQKPGVREAISNTSLKIGQLTWRF